MGRFATTSSRKRTDCPSSATPTYFHPRKLSSVTVCVLARLHLPFCRRGRAGLPRDAASGVFFVLFFSITDSAFDDLFLFLFFFVFVLRGRPFATAAASLRKKTGLSSWRRARRWRRMWRRLSSRPPRRFTTTFCRVCTTRRTRYVLHIPCIQCIFSICPVCAHHFFSIYSQYFSRMCPVFLQYPVFLHYMSSISPVRVQYFSSMCPVFLQYVSSFLQDVSSFSPVCPVFLQCVPSFSPVSIQYFSSMCPFFLQYLSSISPVSSQYIGVSLQCLSSVSQAFIQYISSIYPVFSHNVSSVSSVSPVSLQR